MLLNFKALKHISYNNLKVNSQKFSVFYPKIKIVDVRKVYSEIPTDYVLSIRLVFLSVEF